MSIYVSDMKCDTHIYMSDKCGELISRDSRLLNTGWKSNPYLDLDVVGPNKLNATNKNINPQFRSSHYVCYLRPRVLVYWTMTVEIAWTI